MGFKKYLEETKLPGVIFTWGRFNPAPTISHQEIFNIMENNSKKLNLEPKIYTSNIQNSKKNPLNFSEKIKYIKESVPNFEISGDFKNPYEVLENLSKNYKRIYFVIGEDRVNDYSALYKYAKEWDIDFKIITGLKESNNLVSGTDLRNFAKNNDFNSFKDALAENLKPKAKEIFEKTKSGLNYK